MREHDSRPYGRQMLRLLAAIAVALSSLVVMACASVPAQATDPTSPPTATPASTGEEQAVAEPTHTPTATPTPASSEGQESGSDPEPTSTPTPTSTPASSEPASGAEPPATTTAAVTTTAELVSPSLGDCYGGALSEDPLHCYLLKQAETRGLIDIVAVYDGESQLHVSISEAELTVEMFRFMRAQSYDFYDKWPELVPEEKYGRYTGTPCTRFPLCYLTIVPLDGHEPKHILPPSSAYDYVLLVPGGESGRRRVAGWASWRQLWPRVSAQEGMAGGTGGGPAFDVSDVDVTNFPEIDGNVCLREIGRSCGWWLRFPDVGIAGFHGGGECGTSRSRTLRRTRLGSRPSGGELTRAMA